MTEKVLVRIKGYQWEGEQQTDEPIEVLASGTYHLRNGIVYIVYESYDENEEQPSKSMLKVGEDFVEIHHSGYAQSTMRFKAGETDRSVYCTPAGELSMETKTSSLLIKQEDDALDIEIEYELGINGMSVSNNRVVINVSSVR